MTTTWTKTTAGGKVLVVTYDGMKTSATVDGAAVDGTIRQVAPRTVAGKTVIASCGGLGLTAEEHAACLAALVPPLPPVPAQYRRATRMTRELAAELGRGERAYERDLEEK